MKLSLLIITIFAISNSQIIQDTEFLSGKFIYNSEVLSEVEVAHHTNLCFEGVYVYFVYKNEIKNGLLVQRYPKGEIIIKEYDFKMSECSSSLRTVITTEDYCIYQKDQLIQVIYKHEYNQKETKQTTQETITAAAVISPETWAMFFGHFYDDKNDYWFIAIIIILIITNNLSFFREKIREKLFRSKKIYNSTLLDLDENIEVLTHRFAAPSAHFIETNLNKTDVIQTNFKKDTSLKKSKSNPDINALLNDKMEVLNNQMIEIKNFIKPNLKTNSENNMDSNQVCLKKEEYKVPFIHSNFYPQLYNSRPDQPKPQTLTIDDFNKIINITSKNSSSFKIDQVFCNCGPSACRIGNCKCRNAGWPCNLNCHKNHEHDKCKNPFGIQNE